MVIPLRWYVPRANLDGPSREPLLDANLELTATGAPIVEPAAPSRPQVRDCVRSLPNNGERQRPTLGRNAQTRLPTLLKGPKPAARTLASAPPSPGLRQTVPTSS